VTDLSLDASAGGQVVTGELPAAHGPSGARQPVPDLADLNAALVQAGIRVRAFGVTRVSLEDVFVSLTGEGFDVAG
jgi:ABC-2 type transport system ATP-binding protein